jgi:hypothetical protein
MSAGSPLLNSLPNSSRSNTDRSTGASGSVGRFPVSFKRSHAIRRIIIIAHPSGQRGHLRVGLYYELSYRFRTSQRRPGPRRYLPTQINAMRDARQQLWGINFAAVNRIHVPVALSSMLILLFVSGYALWRRKLDDVTLLAATVSLALLGNAFICGEISGPHDRYGARIVWIATFVVLIVAEKTRLRSR